MAGLVIPGHPRPRPREVSLDEVRAVLGSCQQCVLGQTRTNVVFGTGNPQARVVFVGEGPGRNEDLQGEPFVGAAGKNLNGLLSIAGLTRDEVYVCNVIKCRPPGNRNPKPEEIAACAPYLREQIRSIWPDVIVCLGTFAAHFILRTEARISTLRGRVWQTGHFAVIPTFHPAAALYHAEWQPLLESDFALLGQWLAAHPAEGADGGIAGGSNGGAS